MITTPTTNTLSHAVITAVAHEGFTVTTREGRTARLAIVDDDGNVIEAGRDVEREAWNVAIACYRNFLAGKGYLRVHTTPPGMQPPAGPSHTDGC